MGQVLIIIQTIIALFLTGFILIQSKGTGFGRSWGGGTSFTRRGLEKLVFKATFVFTALFITISLAAYVI